VTEEAVATYQELAAASPDRYRPDLAQALNNLAARLSELDGLLSREDPQGSSG